MSKKLWSFAVTVLLIGAPVSAFSPTKTNRAVVNKNHSKSSLKASTADAPVISSAKTKAPVFDEVCDTTGVTLTRFMNEIAMLNPELRELTTIFGAIDTACKAIANEVKRSQLPFSQTLGYQGEVNVQGEDQKVIPKLLEN